MAARKTKRTRIELLEELLQQDKEEEHGPLNFHPKNTIMLNFV